MAAVMVMTAACQPRAQIANDNIFSDFDPCPDINDSAALVVHNAYTLLYSERDEQPLWVAYMLTRDRANGNEPRTNNFAEDPAVKTGSATLDDYRRSGYTRGHLVPAGDMKWDTTAMSETFLLSNISPQTSAFNDGIWNRLEMLVRRWARTYDTIYIVTGPVLNGGETEHIGRNRVTVPTAFFKAIYVPSRQQAIAFVVKHEASDAGLQTFAISVDDLENITGLDFFHALPDDIETDIESNLCLKCWRWK